MTSFLESDFHDESLRRTASRKAVVVAKQRVDAQFGKALSAYGKGILPNIADELDAVIAGACAEFEHEDVKGVTSAVLNTYFNQPTEQKTAAVHESRKPKMCPFHKDVVDISLSAEDPRAGYDSMAQHWGGPRHCEGDGYEGNKCNFKPQMTTQSYWDEKAEKAQERKDQREQQAAELEAQQPVEEAAGDLIIDEPVAEQTIEPATDGAEVIQFPSAEAVEPSPEPIPMSMAAKTADKDVTGLGGNSGPSINKEKWTPKSVPFLDDVDDADGRNPTRHQDITEPIKAENGDKLEDIGGQVTERVDVAKDTNPSDKGEHTKTWTGSPGSAVSAYGDPQPVMPDHNQQVWETEVGCPHCGSPNTAGEEVCWKCHGALGTGDHLKGPYNQRPTPGPGPGNFASTQAAFGDQYGGNIQRAVDALVGVGFSPEEAQQIVESHPQGGHIPLPDQQGLPQDPNVPSPQGPPQLPEGNFASLKDDVNKNPITDLIESGFEGFIPQDQVQQAIAAYRS